MRVDLLKAGRGEGVHAAIPGGAGTQPAIADGVAPDGGGGAGAESVVPIGGAADAVEGAEDRQVGDGDH